MEDKITMEKRTVDSILAWMKSSVENKNILNPDVWIEAASFLAVLLGDEEMKLYELQQKVAELKLKFYNEMTKPLVSAAEMKIEATDEYKAYQQQKAKISQISEFIRIAKLRVKISSGY